MARLSVDTSTSQLVRLPPEAKTAAEGDGRTASSYVETPLTGRLKAGGT